MLLNSNQMVCVSHTTVVYIYIYEFKLDLI